MNTMNIGGGRWPRKYSARGRHYVYPQNIAKTKFQIQNHQTKIWPNDIPQRLSRSVEEFRAAEPRPQSAEETPM